MRFPPLTITNAFNQKQIYDAVILFVVLIIKQWVFTVQEVFSCAMREIKAYKCLDESDHLKRFYETFEVVCIGKKQFLLCFLSVLLSVEQSRDLSLLSR